jgi:hypothetical protein
MITKVAFGHEVAGEAQLVVRIVLREIVLGGERWNCFVEEEVDGSIWFSFRVGEYTLDSGDERQYWTKARVIGTLLGSCFIFLIILLLSECD